MNNHFDDHDPAKAISNHPRWRILPVIALSLLFAILFIISWVTYGLKASVVGLLPLVALYVFICTGVSFPESQRALLSIGVKNTALCLIIFLSGAALLAVFLSTEQVVYYWDYGAYWYQAKEVLNALVAQPGQAFIDALQTVNAKEYNDLLALFLAVPTALCGGSFTAFAILVYLIFFVPATCIAMILIQILTSKFGKPFPAWLACLIATCSPLFLQPILDGYVDIAGLLFVSLLFLIVLGKPQEKTSLHTVFFFSLSLVAVLLMRRYYAYWVVGFAIGLVVFCILKLVANKERRRHLFFCFLFNYAMAGLAAILLLIVFCNGFLEISLFNNYAAAYSAYDSGANIVGKVREFIFYIGIACVIAIAAGSCLAVSQKQWRAEYALLASQVIASTFAFWRIQDLDPHHYYIVSSSVFLLTILSLYLICMGFSSRKARHSLEPKVAACLICCYSVAGCINMAGFITVPGLFSSSQHPHIERADLEQLKEMSSAIPIGSKVYVTASSTLLNNSLFYNSIDNDEIRNSIQVLPASQVDLRDGFNLDFFEADILIACTPNQTHLEHGQQVVTVLNSLALDPNSIVGKHFKEMGTYQLDGGKSSGSNRYASCTLLKRISEYSDEDIEIIADIFNDLYPDDADLFYNRIIEWELSTK